MIEAIEIGVLPSTPLSNTASGAAFLEVLPQGLFPNKFNDCEPINRSFQADGSEFAEVWSAGVLWRAARPRTRGHYLPSLDSSDHDLIVISTTKSVLESVCLPEYFERVDALAGVDFGYVHARVSGDDDDVRYYMEHLEPFSQGVLTEDLSKGLPNLPWAVVLGPPYREIFGDRLDSAPAFSVRELGNGATYLQLTEDVSDVDRKRDAVRAAREAVQAHLGCNAFREGGHAPLNIPTFFAA